MTDNDTHFGIPDAASESPEHISGHHVVRAYESSMKALDRQVGKQIIVGIKGSGKTDLRRYMESVDGSMVFNLDDDHAYLNIAATQLEGRSGRIKNTIALVVLRAFADFFGGHKKTGKASEKLRSAADRVVEALKRIPSAVDVTTPVGSLKLAELLATDAAPVVQAAWKELAEDVKEALGRNHAYIMIDDAETVFPGIESNADFIEGLARAVQDVNRETRAQLHVLMFLKYGIWRHWFENQREYDRVAENVLVITWDHQHLVQLIARRSARLHDALPSDDEQISAFEAEELWKKEFDWGKSNFDKFSRGITQYCVSGPRDMVVICNLAKSQAKGSRIRQDHIDRVKQRYSERKVFEINADFGDVYPNIHRFVQMVFHGAPARLSGRELLDIIESKGIQEERVERVCGDQEWFKWGTKERLAVIAYEVGLWGRAHDDGSVRHSMEDPHVTAGDLVTSDLVMHPAFRAHLGVDDTAR